MFKPTALKKPGFHKTPRAAAVVSTLGIDKDGDSDDEQTRLFPHEDVALVPFG